MNEEKIYYSKALSLHFKIKQKNENEKVIVFEDGINYSEKEIKELNEKQYTDDELKNIHILKKLYNGKITPKEENEMFNNYQYKNSKP